MELQNERAFGKEVDLRGLTRFVRDLKAHKHLCVRDCRPTNTRPPQYPGFESSATLAVNIEAAPARGLRLNGSSRATQHNLSRNS